MTTKVEPTETVSETIETWKLDLERLLWSYHENGRPDGKTGVIGNPKTIKEFVVKLMEEQYAKGKVDEYQDFLSKLQKRADGLAQSIREQEGSPEYPGEAEAQAYITGLHDMIPIPPTEPIHVNKTLQVEGPSSKEKLTSEPTVEGWDMMAKEIDDILDKHAVNTSESGIYWNWDIGGYNEEELWIKDLSNFLKTNISNLLSNSVQEAKAELADYCIHQAGCPLAYWEQGRPTSDGGYETKWSGKWYKEPDRPKCTCGLDDLLSTLNTKASLKQEEIQDEK